MDDDDNIIDRSEDEREDEEMAARDSDGDDVDNGNDNDGDGDADADADGDAENEMDVDDDDDDDDRDDDGDQDADGDGDEYSQAPTVDSQVQQQETDTTVVVDNKPVWLYSYEHSRQFQKSLLLDGKDSCASYDIAPYVAAPMSTSINCMDLPQTMRWIYTGGQDGYIRKFDFFASVSGKLPLTVAQKHPFPDSITKAGVLVSYWENEIPMENDPVSVTGLSEEQDMKVSPVYALAVQSQNLWLLSGLETGGITLQTIRHAEGKIHAHLHRHTSSVSVLRLNRDETAVISGSWDRRIINWDLNTGNVVREYNGATGQISCIAWRPEVATTMSFTPNSQTPDGPEPERMVAGEIRDDAVEEHKQNTKEDDSDSMGSLFGEDDDENDEEKLAVDRSLLEHSSTTAAVGDSEMQEPQIKPEFEQVKANGTKSNGVLNGTSDNGSSSNPAGPVVTASLNDQTLDSKRENSSNNIILATSIDGMGKLWDSRMSRCIKDITLPAGVPPWCMSACWSLDGNHIYLGRRNGTVEEFSIHALNKPVRSLKLPGGSGPVSCVTPMPNGRHLVCASFDNIRLYDLQATSAGPSSLSKGTITSRVPFLIVPGHHGGTISDIVVDQTCQYMITCGGNRGWEGSATEVMIMYEIENIM